MKYLNKKLIVLILCMMLLIIAIIAKQNAIKNDRNRIIVSSIAEWKELGVPVIVMPIKKKDVEVVSKVTLKPITKFLWQGFVTQEVKQHLKNGQKVMLTQVGQVIEGQIKTVVEELNVETGMYKVEVEFKQELVSEQIFVVGYIVTQVFRDVINIDNEDAQLIDGIYFVWLAQENQARMKKIDIRSMNGYGLVVASGLEVGDLLIVDGQSKLEEGDKLRVIEQVADVKGENS